MNIWNPEPRSTKMTDGTYSPTKLRQPGLGESGELPQVSHPVVRDPFQTCLHLPISPMFFPLSPCNWIQQTPAGRSLATQPHLPTSPARWASRKDRSGQGKRHLNRAHQVPKVSNGMCVVGALALNRRVRPRLRRPEGPKPSKVISTRFL